MGKWHACRFLRPQLEGGGFLPPNAVHEMDRLWSRGVYRIPGDNFPAAIRRAIPRWPCGTPLGLGLQHLGVHDSACLVDGDQAVGRDCLETLTDAAGPTHLDIGGRLGAEAEVEAPVIHRQEAGLPGHLPALEVA